MTLAASVFVLILGIGLYAWAVATPGSQLLAAIVGGCMIGAGVIGSRL